jgi:hypothetical protein
MLMGEQRESETDIQTDS